MVAQTRSHYHLTPKEEALIRAVLTGKTAAEAYRSVYNTKGGKASNHRFAAYDILSRPDVAARLRELRDAADSQTLLTRTRKRHLLFEIAENKRHKAGERIAAIKVDNEMSGDNAAVKVEGELTLGIVLNSLKQVTPIHELPAAEPEPEPLTLQAAETREEISPLETVTGVVGPEQSVQAPAIPSTPGPFDDAGDVSVVPSFPAPAKSARTREYEE